VFRKLLPVYGVWYSIPRFIVEICGGASEILQEYEEYMLKED